MITAAKGECQDWSHYLLDLRIRTDLHGMVKSLHHAVGRCLKRGILSSFILHLVHFLLCSTHAELNELM